MCSEDLVALALENGFTHAAVADASVLKPMQEVRDMCAVNSCHRYGVCWSCPPACGELEECAEKLSHYRHTLVVQTVGELEDSWDYESMRDTEDRQKASQEKLLPILREKLGDVLPLGVGSCRQCQTCTYPDAPCRFPEKAFSSMEAYGLLVSQVCTDSGLKYNHGPNTIAYTGCFLF